ncbi:hypothetical protein NUH88_06985 [Nisaea acidiphila]|uniref:UDP-2,4-diacetamido-2,4, 6-trideoxy-beta-L-altropyranose hydrolase n=1 Tax=Nisaea acidiphila TaxID=1862145 RepID=A0A9J7AYD0_9PROT|nr:hypothetical protein [Nisaea acidiphila]UUX51433.1 hypothetical protein NUH88_06985 [Nisaea acidiphila]
MLAIRADADARIGLGHVMRCFALAEGWRARGGEAAVFSGGELPGQVADRLARAGIDFRMLAASDDGGELALAVSRLGADWLVVDGPFAGADYVAAARRSAPVLLIDDAAALAPFPVDLLLNQNVQAREESYAAWSGVRVLAGPRYALIRADLRQDVRKRAIRDIPERVLVLVGGADPNRYLEMLAEAARDALQRGEIGEGRVDAVIGPANPWRPAASVSGSITYHTGVRDLGSLISAADIALSSAGSAVGELALHGTPMVLGASVPVEEPVGAGMAAEGAAVYLGRLGDCARERVVTELVRLLRDAGARQGLSRAASTMVDGRGVERVIDAMLELTGRAGGA